MEAISSSASTSAVTADFGTTIRQASLLTPRVVIGSKNNSPPRSTTLMPGADVTVAPFAVEFCPNETDAFAHCVGSCGRKVAVCSAGSR